MRSPVVGWSSMQPDEAEVQHAMDLFLDRALRQNSPLLDPASAAFGKLLQLLLPRTAFKAVARQLFLRSRRPLAPELPCSFITSWEF